MNYLTKKGRSPLLITIWRANMRLLAFIIMGLLSLNSYAIKNSSLSQMVDTQCMSCHAADNYTNAPMMSGQNLEFLEFELFNFRDYSRDHEIMNQVMEDFTDQEVKEIASYISGLSLCDAQAQVDEHPEADLIKGKKIFNQSCIACHNKDTLSVGPVIHSQKTIYLEEAIKSFQSTWYEPRPSRINMRSHTDMLSEQDIKDVAAYLNVQKLCD